MKRADVSCRASWLERRPLALLTMRTAVPDLELHVCAPRLSHATALYLLARQALCAWAVAGNHGVTPSPAHHRASSKPPGP